MTRVLMTVDTVGGVWTYSLELAAALAAQDVEVHLATMGRRLDAGQRIAVEQSAVASVAESGYALEWMPDPWAEVDRAGDWLLELVAELSPDLVHLNGYCHAALGLQAPTVVVGHSDVLSWWDAVHGTAAPASYDTYRERVTQGLAAAGAVVAPTQAALDDLGRNYGVNTGTVVANCRRTDWLRPTEKEPLVLAAGRVWDEAKNLGAVAAVAAELPWRVAIAGEGASEPGPARFLGALSFMELSGWLLRASVYAVPARYEPFGLGVLEAAQAGCALVLGDIPSLREIWQEAAVYVDPDDRRALSGVLQELTADPDRVSRLAARARERATRYTPEATARGYLDVYRRLPIVVSG